MHFDIYVYNNIVNMIKHEEQLMDSNQRDCSNMDGERCNQNNMNKGNNKANKNNMEAADELSIKNSNNNNRNKNKSNNDNDNKNNNE